MTQQELILILEGHWAEPKGFFWLVRVGIYIPAMQEDVYNSLSELKIGPEESIERRRVSLLWFIPTFLGWQKEQLKLEGDLLAHYTKWTQKITDLLIDVLGCP